MIPAVGDRVGPYEILGRLGRGGMGLVFSAWDSRLQRDVAIKLLREEYIRGDSHERFLTEARAASGLNHPNICTIFDIGEQDGDPYLVMELLKGDTLRQRIASGSMPVEEILSAAIEIADALGAAHARGIIHRDIKPANIFLVAKPIGGWQAKVLDFGLAKIELPDDLDPRYQITGQGSAVGTVAYMSPEQARGEPLDARSDLFALGIVLYEMATGHVPFEGVTSALIFVQLLTEDPKSLRQLDSNFPKDLERIILKLLAKERSERFQSAAELLVALRKIDLKKPNSRPGIFDIPVVSWVKDSVSNSSISKAVFGGPRLPPGPLSPQSRPIDEIPDFNKPVSEAVTIRPIKRPALPPTELSGSVAHWVRPPNLGGIGPGPKSSGEHVAAVMPVEAPLKMGAPPPVLEMPNAVAPGLFASAAETQDAGTVAPETPVAERPSFRELVEAAKIANPQTVLEQKSALWPMKWIWALIAVVVIALLWAAVVHFKKVQKPPVAHRAEMLMLGPIANRSGDKTLDGIVLAGLRFDLAQSPHVSVPDASAMAGAARTAGVASVDNIPLADARRAATAANATSVLSGEVLNEAGKIGISVEIYNVATGATILQAEETADRREQIVDAIDRLSAQIRIGLGEPGDIVGRKSVPLARDVTSNVKALAAYVAATEAESGGRSLDAIVALQHAVLLEPKFTQAWLKLAEIYSSEHAEVAAADAATRAQEASVGTSDRTKLLAQASYQLHTTADYPHALTSLDRIVAGYPLDASIAARRALLLNAQGEFPEALEAAQEALSRNPYDLEASAQAEYAMFALDRAQEAAHMDAQAQQRGQSHPEVAILLALLDGGATPEVAASGSGNAQMYRAQVLDAAGQLSEGADAWKSIERTAKAMPSLASAASYALAQEALDHALVDDCGLAKPLAVGAAALPRGQAALFAAGMAQGLCGDVSSTRNTVLALMARYPQSFAVKHYYLADLTAIDQIRSGDSAAALATLQGVKQYDLLSLSPYLRGLAHSSGKQWALAIADFQFVMQNRGATTLVDPPMYAMAQLGLARAYAASGDKANSAAAYGAFLQTWKKADASNALVAEAQKHSK